MVTQDRCCWWLLTRVWPANEKKNEEWVMKERKRDNQREWNKKNDPNSEERFLLLLLLFVSLAAAALQNRNWTVVVTGRVAQGKLITFGCSRRKVFSSLSSVSHDSLVFGLLLLLLLLLGQTSKQTGKKSAGELSVTFRFVLITLRNRRERERE